MKHHPPPVAVDLLAHAIRHVRVHFDRSLPAGERARDFWAAVIAARDLGTVDIVEQGFIELARQTGLAGDIGTDGVAHIIRFAFLDQNPFC